MATTEANKAKSYDYLLKLLVIGDSGVGKTCFLCRFTDDVFSSTFISTIGIDFKVKTIVVKDKRVKDTAGQERFYNVTASYYRGAMGIIVMYDVTDQESFENIGKWLDKANENTREEVVKMIVGNKCDLEAKRLIPREMGELLGKQSGIPFVEASAKSNMNVDKVFNDLASLIIQKKFTEASASNTIKVKQDGSQQAEKSCCR